MIWNSDPVLQIFTDSSEKKAAPLCNGVTMPVVPDSTCVLRGKGVFILILVQVLRDARWKYSKQTAIRPYSKKLLGERQAYEEFKTEDSKN